MTKFNIGNRVRAITDVYYQEGIRKNQTGVVESLNDDLVFVRPDVLNSYGSDQTWTFHDYELELVEDQPMPTPEYSCIRVVPPSKPKREIVENQVLFASGARLSVKPLEYSAVSIRGDGYEFTATALREAAALFTTLAEILEENA